MSRMQSKWVRLLAGVAMLASVATSASAQPARGSGGLPPRDEWQRVPEILAALAHPSEHNGLNSEFRRDTLSVEFFALVSHDRTGRTDFQIWQLREAVDERFR